MKQPRSFSYFSNALRRLRKGLALAGLSSLALVGSAQAALPNHSPNLIPDPGFEGGSLSNPITNAFGATVSIDSGEALTGGAALRMDTTGTAYTQPWKGSSRAALAAVSCTETFHGWV